MFKLESNYVVNKCHGRHQNQSRKDNRGKFKVSFIHNFFIFLHELEIYKVTLDYLIIIIKI